MKVRSVTILFIPVVYGSLCIRFRVPLTLDGSFGTHCRDSSKRSHHKVLKHPVGNLITVTLVFAETWDAGRGPAGTAAAVEFTVEGGSVHAGRGFVGAATRLEHWRAGSGEGKGGGGWAHRGEGVPCPASHGRSGGSC